MSTTLPALESLTLPDPYQWVRKPESREWWASAAVYPDWVTGRPSPGDRVFVCDQMHIYAPKATTPESA